jgi:isopentenyl phosphate kinase
MAFQPSSSFSTKNRQIQYHFDQPIIRALEANILPVVYGDVVFDETLGGSILSTEDIFYYLAKNLIPAKIILAGLEDSIWLDFPENINAVTKITVSNFDLIKSKIGQSASIDVTGGMIEKVRIMLNLTSQIPKLKIAIISGKVKGNITRAYNNEKIGTWIEPE